MEKFSDQEFLEYLVRSLVDHPDAVKIERSIDQDGVLLSLTVHAEDMGQIVGREGKTAKSIRSLLRILGMKNNVRVSLKILEPEGGMRAPKAGQATPSANTLQPGDPIADEIKL